MSSTGYNKGKRKKRYRLTPLGKLVVYGIPIVLIIAIGYGIFSSSKRVKEYVDMEAGDKLPAIESFLLKDGDKGAFMTVLEDIDTTKPGSHKIIIRIGKKEYESTLNIKDTVPPVITTRKAIAWNGRAIEPKELVEEIIDVTDVNIRYITEPEYTKIGIEQHVIIEAVDAGGNSTKSDAIVEVIEDKEPPVIIGATDKAVYIGKTLSYKADIILKDAQDSSPELKIDNSQVDLTTPGKYPVTYTATDKAGNSNTITIYLTVREDDGSSIDAEKVNAMADEILAGITTPDMKELDKIRAIYNWVTDNVRYSNASDKEDWIKEAYIAMTKKTGDCYTFFAITQLLLNRAQIENMKVSRDTDKIKTRHYWNLVNTEDGWYHLDTCPHFKTAKFDSFMRTDAELEEYTNKYSNNPEVYYYYTFDKDAYPERSKTPISQVK